MYNISLPYDNNITVYNYKDGIKIFKEEINKAVVTVKGKNENAKSYLNIIMAFDIETTKVLNLNYEPKMAKMFKYFNVVFCWQCSINGRFIFGRSIDEFFYMVDEINRINKKGYIICYVHNLAYEMNNLKDYFFSRVTEDGAFFKNKTTALYLRCGTIQFQCSKELTHLSLAKIGDNIGYKKLKGDFDYNKERYIDTELTPLEMNYCYRDVMILDKFIRSECQNYCMRVGVSVSPCNLPLTSTGYVRRDVQKNFSKTPSGKLILQKTALTEDVYKDISKAYWGGYTHADFKKICQTFDNVGHRDITSAYPSRFFKSFPYTLILGTENENIKQFKQNLKRKNFAIIANITLKGNVGIKKHKIPFLPESRCSGKSIVAENGKVLMADEVTFWACECDINIILKIYKYDEIVINKYYWGNKKPLPWCLVNTVISYFKNKTIYKDVEGKEVEYALAKQLLNGVYGMSGTACIHSKLEIIGLDVLSDQEEYTPSNTMPYLWAIYITSYVRELLYTFIDDLATKFNDAFIYSDTDSIFYIKSKETEKYFDDYNNQNMVFLETMEKIYPDAIPKTPKGKKQYLGAFELENDDIAKFITLGSKRYAITHSDGLIDVTFAGLSATKCVKTENGKENGYNTNRLIEMYGSIEKAFEEIRYKCIVLPYIEGIDKLSNYNTIAEYRGICCGVEVTRPCSYVLYGQSTTLSLNKQLFDVLLGDYIDNVLA